MVLRKWKSDGGIVDAVTLTDLMRLFAFDVCEVDKCDRKITDE